MTIPKLIMLVGIPGSGKSTYAKDYIKKNPDTLHLSSDKIREELWGSESVQGDPNEVFSLMQSRAVEALKKGTDVIYDATNINRKDRAHIIDICPKFAKIEARIIWAPIETCIRRDAGRKRTVGKSVIDMMLKRFQPPFYDEGFDNIKIILPEDFNSTEYRKRVQEKMHIPHDNPHHTLGVWEHCLAAYKYARDDVDILMAALFHDIGKPYVKSFKDTKGNVSETAHYYSHDNVGAWMVYGIEMVDPYIAWLVGNHMGPFMNTKYYKNLPPFLKEAIDHLHECDLNAH